ncbi:MAG TPA: signal peptidase I [Pyrinomonadaceae bacterium]
MFGIKKRRAPLFGSVAAEDDKDIEVHKPRDVARHSFWSESRLLARDLLFALMFAALLVVFVVQPVKVEGTSMEPNLHDGERIFVNKLIYYGLPNLQRGDIVVFWFPENPSKSYIKRIIGMPGETVVLCNGRVFINGVLLNEPYVTPERNRRMSSTNFSSPAPAPEEPKVGKAFYKYCEDDSGATSSPPPRVPEHYYFVLGDNRDASSDSRSWGVVPEKYIYGKALFRYWPLARMSTLPHETNYNIPSKSPSPSPTPPGSEEESPD